MLLGTTVDEMRCAWGLTWRESGRVARGKEWYEAPLLGGLVWVGPVDLDAPDGRYRCEVDQFGNFVWDDVSTSPITAVLKVKAYVEAKVSGGPTPGRAVPGMYARVYLDPLFGYDFGRISGIRQLDGDEGIHLSVLTSPRIARGHKLSGFGDPLLVLVDKDDNLLEGETEPYESMRFSVEGEHDGTFEPVTLDLVQCTEHTGVKGTGTWMALRHGGDLIAIVAREDTHSALGEMIVRVGALNHQLKKALDSLVMMSLGATLSAVVAEEEEARAAEEEDLRRAAILRLGAYIADTISTSDKRLFWPIDLIKAGIAYDFDNASQLLDNAVESGILSAEVDILCDNDHCAWSGPRDSLPEKVECFECDDAVVDLKTAGRTTSWVYAIKMAGSGASS